MPWYVGPIILFSIILVIVIIVLVVVIKIKRAVKSFSMEAFGTDSLAEGLKLQNDKLSETPKSIKAMTNILLPRIEKDFPEFSYNQYKEKAEELLRSFLIAVSSQDMSVLEGQSQEIKNQAQSFINTFSAVGKKVFFDDVVIHNTQICNYRKKNGNVYIEFHSAVGYYYYVENGKGKVIEGSKETKRQTSFIITLAYIQDRLLSEKNGSGAHGINCPNCGAPINYAEGKFCQYCGTGVAVEINIRIWDFISVNEDSPSSIF